MAAVRRIVVGVDESAGAADALRWALAEAQLRDAELTAVLAWDLLDQHHAVAGERFDPSYGSAEAEAAVRRYVAEAVGDEAAAAVHTAAVCDLPARALLDASATADLVVVGARGLGGFRGLLLGSVSQHCLHHTTVPIAIVRPELEPPDPGGRVVVGVDGSESSQRALRWAIDEARAREALLDVVIAWHLPYTGIIPEPPSTFDVTSHKQAAAELVDRAIAAEDVVDVHVRPVVLRRQAAGGLLHQAAGAALLVVGSHGYKPFKRATLGSVATQVSHHATCPVVVVPSRRAPA